MVLTRLERGWLYLSLNIHCLKWGSLLVSHITVNAGRYTASILVVSLLNINCPVNIQYTLIYSQSTVGIHLCKHTVKHYIMNTEYTLYNNNISSSYST